MPMVGGKKYPYTDEGKKKAKKAAVAGMLAKKKGKKQNWSGAKSQLGY
jgi:hypothetical protein